MNKRNSGAYIHLCLLLGLAGCQTPTPLPPIDFSQPGWRVREGQAIWKSRSDQSETVGELWVGTHPSGKSLVQFSKTPFPLVEARRAPGLWQIQFSLENRTERGTGRPPPRWLWLHVATALEHGPLPPSITAKEEGSERWQLRNSATGEELTLALDP